MRKFTGRVPKQFVYGLLIGACVMGYGWVGGNDYDQQVASAELYCEMSSTGGWPPRPELNCPKPLAKPDMRVVAL